jgi:riboflavin kinase/FMN adenylyltransferase
VDHVIVLETTPELLALEADEFFAQVLHEQLKASVVVEGPDFRFGRDRRGDVARLRQLCRESGMHFATAAAVRCERGEVISSSRVRTALEAGEVEAAERLLDRPYGLTGRVVVGQRRGRSLGFPTANLDAIETVVPKDGVYAVRVHLSDACFAGAAHVGPRPTFGENQKSVEVHLIDFEGNLYDRELEVDFLHRLRDTQFFPEPHALAAQLRADVEQARRLASPGSS